jgi:hypothetical protein
VSCVKRRFQTEAEAREVAWKLAHAVYQCPRCGLWNTTKAAQGPEDVAREAEALAVVQRDQLEREAREAAKHRARRLRRSGRRHRP